MTKLKRQGVPGKVRRSMPVGIDYAALLKAITHVHADAQRHAVQTVNMGLTLRNWAIGYDIVEYEMNGSDRAQYGERLLDSLARDLVRRLGRGFARRNLFQFREFYRTYPIVQSLIAQFNLPLPPNNQVLVSRYLLHLPTQPELDSSLIGRRQSVTQARVFLAPKGPNTTAQGNALGTGTGRNSSPERA